MERRSQLMAIITMTKGFGCRQQLMAWRRGICWMKGLRQMCGRSIHRMELFRLPMYGYDLMSQVQSGVSSFYLVDGFGSTRLLTDAQGQVLNSYGMRRLGRL